MNVLASECSSGCESGWTLYLEQSYVSQHPSGLHRGNSNGFCEEYKEKRISCSNEDEEEEDQSMVSDASSGPPHFNEDEVYFDENNNGYFCPPSKDVRTLKFGGKKQKIKEKGRCGVQDQQQQQPSFLDDTASSPFFNISKNNFMVSNNQASGDSVMDFSQGFSSTHFQGRSAYQDHYGFLQSTLPGNQLQDQNQWFEGNEITRSSYHQ
ncbi:protein SOB FIVE-LIKE 5 [Rosa sericea]